MGMSISRTFLCLQCTGRQGIVTQQTIGAKVLESGVLSVKEHLVSLDNPPALDTFSFIKRFEDQGVVDGVADVGVIVCSSGTMGNFM